MAGTEKRNVLRLRAEALHRRTKVLSDQFKSQDIQEHLRLAALRIEEELDWLEENAEKLQTVRLPLFLPEITMGVTRLADLYRVAGPHARLPPYLDGRLDGHRDGLKVRRVRARV